MLALGQSMVAPVIPGLTRSFGVGLGQASLVFVAASAGAVAVTFPAGYLMDRIGRRPVLLAGPLLTAVASLMTPFSHSFLELLFWRFLVGAADQMWQQGRVLVIADTAHHSQRARQMQWMMGMTRAGQLLGPSIGGLLADALGIWIPFALHAGLTLLAVIPSFRLIKESAPGRRGRSEDEAEMAQQGWRPVLKYILTFQILVFFVVQAAAQLSRGGQDQGSLSLYAVYAYGMSPGELGRLNTAAIALGLPVPFLTGYFMDRFGRRAVIAPGFASYALALVIMSFTGFFPLPIAFFVGSYILVQATAGTTGGTMQVLGADLSPTINRGRFFAVWRMIAQLAAAISPAAFAFLAEHISYGVGFLYLSTWALVVVVCVAWILGDTRRST
ncbi:MAG TPA: MFS transporter [Chloroflexota bacterium]|nr:MFS transporter [Chloroflexota bacterium]